MLICAQDAIFDQAAFDALFDDVKTRLDDPKEQKIALLGELQRQNQLGRQTLKKAFQDAPRAAQRLNKSYTYLTDCLILCIWKIATEILDKTASKTNAERLCVLAVGGYGRGNGTVFGRRSAVFVPL